MNYAFILALTLIRESPDEPGMRAVASVIHERTAFPCPEAYVNECLRPKRYSCWNSTSPSMDMVYKYNVRPEWKIAIRIAREMVSGNFKPTVKATHYCRTDVMSHTNWVSSMEVVATIGEHTYMREP